MAALFRTSFRACPMPAPGIHLEIPGFGSRHITTVITDYTGTLSCGGRLSEGVRESLVRLAELVAIHVVTADTYGLAGDELRGLPLTMVRLASRQHDVEKREYGERCGLEHCCVLGNGNNDRLLLKAAKDAGGIAVAVDNGEGCATEAVVSSNLCIRGAVDALGLLLNPKGLIATLRC